VVGKGAWDAIFSLDEHNSLVSMINDRSRKHTRARTRSLLAGIIICDICGQKMNLDSGGGGPAYRCRNRPGTTNCGSNTIVAAPVNVIIEEAVFAVLDSKRLAKVLQKRDKSDTGRAAQELADVERRLDVLAESFGDGQVSHSEWMAARSKLDARAQAARATLDASDNVTQDWVGKGEKLRKIWEKLSDDQKREIVAAVVREVRIRPVSPEARRNRFDPSRVVPMWAH
jgi:hypothetical protein